MRSCCSRSNRGFGDGLVDLVLVSLPFRHLLSFPRLFPFNLSLPLPFALPLPFSLPLPLPLSLFGQQVAVVLQTVHVWQQQFSRLQRYHVFKIVVFVPGWKDIRMGVVGVKKDAGSRRRRGQGKVGGKGQRGANREDSVVRHPVPDIIVVVGVTWQGCGQTELLAIRNHEGQSF